jgi:hypothetical protein
VTPSRQGRPLTLLVACTLACALPVGCGGSDDAPSKSSDPVVRRAQADAQCALTSLSGYPATLSTTMSSGIATRAEPV